MDKNVDFIGGLFFGLSKDLELPDELRDFLSQDDQGMEGLEFMLKDSNLCKRIPDKVRAEYEALYATLCNKVFECIDEQRKELDEISSNPQKIVHSMIQDLFESK